MPLFEAEKNQVLNNLLTDRFLVPPFSILDTKQGYWQSRRSRWLKLGIKSEEGRDAGCLPSGFDEAKYGKKISEATSIFDPVLCEIAYRWFSREGDKVIDPFAGGSVRGIVASILRRNYTGIDLSAVQIDANKKQLVEINDKFGSALNVNWVNGDSLTCKEIAKDEYNLLFTCPPYYDLEVYSDKDNDLSNMGTYKEFMEVYTQIIKNACDMLVDDSFAVIVVGNMRNHTNGAYYDFVGDTVKAFEQAGLIYYNEMVLVNTAGTLPLRAPKIFNASRKAGRQHQNVLVFYKGNPRNIGKKFGEVVGLTQLKIEGEE